MSRERAIRLRVTVHDDHVVHLPDDVPVGEAEVIVLVPERAASHSDAERRARLRSERFGALRGAFTIAPDFDAPLPDDILRDFEGR